MTLRDYSVLYKLFTFFVFVLILLLLLLIVTLARSLIDPRSKQAAELRLSTRLALGDEQRFKFDTPLPVPPCCGGGSARNRLAVRPRRGWQDCRVREDDREAVPEANGAESISTKCTKPQSQVSACTHAVHVVRLCTRRKVHSFASSPAGGDNVSCTSSAAM